MRATIARSTRGDFVRQHDCSKRKRQDDRKKNNREMRQTVRLKRMLGIASRNRVDNVMAKSIVISSAARPPIKSANYPEITGNHIRDPGDVTRQLLDRTVIFLHRHYEQVCVHRLNKVRQQPTQCCRECSAPQSEPRLRQLTKRIFPARLLPHPLFWIFRRRRHPRGSMRAPCQTQ